MDCPRCGAPGRDGARFCECGAALLLACPRCGAEPTVGSRYCAGCGGALGAAGPYASPETYTPAHLATQILTSRGAFEGERKQVTVLFCDLAGSTALAERLGPEGMHAVLSRFFELALAEVHRYEGTVNQFLGDGFMALFGAPIACEDHGRRAVLAALGVQRALAERGSDLGLPPGEAFAVRMGVNTGMVVVGKIGDNLRMDYTAIGDTTNVAGRLEGLAEAGTILIGESTANAVRGYFRLKPLGPLTVKGKADPIAAYLVLGPGPRRSRIDGAGDAGFTAFVGRERELAHLPELLGKVEAGEGQVVGIVGEPGVGKSRLLREFRRRLDDRPLVWLEGHCLSYGQAIPYLPVLDIIRQTCGIAETDDPATIADKARGALIGIGLSAEEGLPYLLHLLGLKDGTEPLARLSPEAVKARTFELLREMTLAGSRQRLLLLVVEDLHWVDGSSEEYAASLVDQVARARVLLLVTYRPGYRPRWMDKSNATQLVLPQLSAGESLAVLRSVRQDLPEPLAQVILDRASGNPLFLEELGRAAGEARGLARPAAVPDTIQDVLGARIDRVAETPRRLLQTASVLGREFSLRLLGAIWPEADRLDQALADLVRLEFLSERSGGPERAFVFRHALVQEVAYASLLEGRRRAAHAQVGRALEGLYAGRIHEVVELLAHHFGKSAEAERAVDYAILAAEKAQQRWANAAALAHFEAALARLDAMPDSEANRLRRIDAVIKQAEVRFALGQDPEHIQALEGIRDLVETTGDPARRAAWHYWTGFLHSITGGRPEAALAYCREAAAIADAGGFDEIRAQAECCLAQVLLVAGEFRSALASGERALGIFESRGNVWWACRAIWQISPAANALGEWERSLAYCRRALEHGQALDDRRLKTVAWLRTGGTHALRGDLHAALTCCAEALALSPSPFDAAMVQGVHGYTLVKAGDLRDGTAELERAVAWFDRSRLRYVHSQYALWLSEGYLRQGERARARGLLEDVLAASRDTDYRYLEGIAERLLGECLAPTDPPAAARHLATAARILEPIGARNEVGKVRVAEGELARAAGDAARARALLEAALAIFVELGTLDEPARVHAALEALA